DANRWFSTTQKRDISRERSLDSDQAAAGVALTLQEPGPSPSDAALDRENCLAVQDALARLQPLDRQVIELRTFEGRTFEAVAGQVGRTTEAARKIWCRAIEKLAAELRQPPLK